MEAVFILICTAVFRSRAGLSLSRLRMEPRAFLQLWYRLAPTCFLGHQCHNRRTFIIYLSVSISLSHVTLPEST